jgi:ADP-heptose:LPS heptosyltransferase
MEKLRNPSPRVLIFKVNQLGDNIIFLPVVQRLRQQAPEIQITLLTSPLAAPIYEDDLPPQSIISIETKVLRRLWQHPRAMLRCCAAIVGRRFDSCLITEDQPNSAYLLAASVRCASRIGLKPSFIRTPLPLTHSLPPDGMQIPKAQLAWKLGMLLWEALGKGKPDWPADPIPPRFSGWVKDVGRIPNRIVIHPGGSIPVKRWPYDRFLGLAQALAPDFEVILVASASDEPDLAIPSVAFARTETLRDLARLIASASLFVGNHSGPFHLASALAVPCLVISGPTPPKWDPIWYPQVTHVLRAPVPCLPCETGDIPVASCANREAPMACMEFWSVEEVAARCKILLNGRPASQIYTSES